ncbi:hypothetical protein RvY_11769-2 [Ramazzottius varieornatus]|uniref:Uncharacterized protein n=1 Tax=Ramazzottius varieornatus TaxID=947166 RepID=A0A1D1VH89_RAMVA|nr:hypothetical protein RvY_11769-2 [Ramazzottius varieornatus]
MIPKTTERTWRTLCIHSPTFPCKSSYHPGDPACPATLLRCLEQTLSQERVDHIDGSSHPYLTVTGHHIVRGSIQNVRASQSDDIGRNDCDVSQLNSSALNERSTLLVHRLNWKRGQCCSNMTFSIQIAITINRNTSAATVSVMSGSAQLN